MPTIKNKEPYRLIFNATNQSWFQGETLIKENRYNERGEEHGYWESYFESGKIFYSGEYINGLKHGYWEGNFSGGQVWYKGTYDMGNYVGLWVFDNEKIFYAN